MIDGSGGAFVTGFFFALTTHSHYEFLTDYTLNRRKAMKAPYIRAPNRA